MNPTHTLSFTLEFPYSDDTVYLAYCYPYTYSHLQDRLLLIQVKENSQLVPFVNILLDAISFCCL